jgi:hypothetical protein
VASFLHHKSITVAVLEITEDTRSNLKDLICLYSWAVIVQDEESAELFGKGSDVGELVSEWKDPDLFSEMWCSAEVSP